MGDVAGIGGGGECGGDRHRIADEAGYLASDELEGRGLDTKGINLAAEYLAKQFADIGLKTALFDGTPFQKFTVTTSSQLGPAEKNSLMFVGPPGALRWPPPTRESLLPVAPY